MLSCQSVLLTLLLLLALLGRCWTEHPWLDTGGTGVLYLHIPKTAGTTINNMLLAEAASRGVSFVWTSQFDAAAERASQQMARCGGSWDRSGVVTGHIHLDLPALERVYGIPAANWRIVTTLREPVARILSSFCFFAFASRPDLAKSCEDDGTPPLLGAMCDRPTFEAEMLRVLRQPDGEMRHPYPVQAIVSFDPLSDDPRAAGDVVIDGNWSDWASRVSSFCASRGLDSEECERARATVRSRLGTCQIPIRNQMVSQLSGVLPQRYAEVCGPGMFGVAGTVDAVALELAKTNIESLDIFVGFQVDLVEDLRKLRTRLVGNNGAESPAPGRRVLHYGWAADAHPLCSSSEKLSAATAAEIRRLNALDVELYEWALARRNESERIASDSAPEPSARRPSSSTDAVGMHDDQEGQKRLREYNVTELGGVEACAASTASIGCCPPKPSSAGALRHHMWADMPVEWNLAHVEQAQTRPAIRERYGEEQVLQQFWVIASGSQGQWLQVADEPHAKKIAALAMARQLASEEAATTVSLDVVDANGATHVLQINRAEDPRDSAVRFCDGNEFLRENGALCLAKVHEVSVQRLALQSCVRRRLMVVARPDAESIFGADAFAMSSPGDCWTVVCATGGSDSSLRGQFEGAMSALRNFLPSVGAALERHEMWRHHSCLGRVPVSPALHGETVKVYSSATLEGDLTAELSRQAWAQVVTHGVAGEFGHPEHREIHKILVRDAAVAGVPIDRIFFFRAVRGDTSRPLRDAMLGAYLLFSRADSDLHFWKGVGAQLMASRDADEAEAMAWCKQNIPPQQRTVLLCRV